MLKPNTKFMSKINFTPFRDFIVIASPTVKSTTESGIFIPEKAQKSEPSMEQIVLAAGPEAECKAGDTILLHPDAAWFPVRINNVEYAVLTKYATIGVIGAN